MIIPGIGFQTYLILFLIVTVQGSYHSARDLFIFGTCQQKFHGRVLAVISVMGFCSSFLTPVFTSLVVDRFDGNWNVLNFIFLGIMGGVLGLLVVLVFIWRGRK